MKFYMLASGSKGNAFVLDTHDQKILIDCGTTRRYLNEAFEQIGYDKDMFDNILITHNHSDHISQIRMFKDHPNVYSPEALVINHTLVKPYVALNFGSVRVLPLATSHDADVSVGYVIEASGKKLVYMTDTGYVRDSDLEYMMNADLIVIESNHDPHLLMNTKRPYMTKQRILSDYGHLSNDEAGRVLSKIVSDRTQDVILAHLSGEANNEALALATVSKYLNGYKGRLRAARQFEIISGELSIKGVSD